jgi:hypothetical protein
LSSSVVVADRTVRNSRDAEDYICNVKNLNDGHCAIGEAVIILTSSLRHFRLEADRKLKLGDFSRL